MCGCFPQTASPEVIAQQFELDDPPLSQPRYNIAPSQSIAAIRIDPDSTIRKLVMLRWGLIPSWAKVPKIGNQCINAKMETVAEKPSFRSAFKKRRCLVFATGFYEWRVQGRTKQPMWIGLRSKRPFAFAGLWEHWIPAEGGPLETCTIITTRPNDLMVRSTLECRLSSPHRPTTNGSIRLSSKRNAIGPGARANATRVRTDSPLVGSLLPSPRCQYG